MQLDVQIENNYVMQEETKGKEIVVECAACLRFKKIIDMKLIGKYLICEDCREDLKL